MKYFIILFFLLMGGGVVFAAFSYMPESTVTYNAALLTTEAPPKEKKVVHLETPEPLKGIYMTQCVASRKDLRTNLVKLIEETELNAIVIDIKDYSGVVAFETGNESVDEVSGGVRGCKVNDMKEFVESLHDKNIYVVGRVTVFQDPLYTRLYPEFAVKKKSDPSVNWKDRKGLSFIDVGAKKYWDHVVAIATSSYAIGFDEINFDYIRYPSDGNMEDIYFSHSGSTTKREMLRQFFEYVDNKLSGTGVVTSADLFGMTTTDTTDMGIGQILEYALLSFDYVSPMIYPSHYPPKFNGWSDPNKVPYEIVKFGMDEAVARTHSLYAEIATTTPNAPVLQRINPLQLRPWLQDFDYPVDYTPEMVRVQIKATYDAGLTSWMLWDPSNIYTREALQLE